MNRREKRSAKNFGKILNLTKPQTDFFIADIGTENFYKIIALVTGYGGGKTFLCLYLQ